MVAASTVGRMPVAGTLATRVRRLDGSSGRHELDRALTEVNAIIATVVPGDSVRVLSVDTCVHTDQNIHSTAQLQLAGAGGTDMAAGIYAAAESNPDAIVHRRLDSLAGDPAARRPHRHRRPQQPASQHRQMDPTHRPHNHLTSPQPRNINQHQSLRATW